MSNQQNQPLQERRRLNKVILGVLGVLLVVIVLILAIGGDGDDTTASDDSSSSAKPSASVKPTKDASSASGSLTAKGVEAAFVETAGEPVKDLCKIGGPSEWACYYDGVKVSGPYLRVELSTPADADEDEIVKRAGLHWFNFVGCTYPDLDIIIVVVNGVDHNVMRSDTNADALC